MPALRSTASTKVVDDAETPWVSALWGEAAPDLGAACLDVLSIPFDGAVSHRAGCRHGPEAVLAAFMRFSSYCIDRRRSFAPLRLVDRGVVDVVRDLRETYARIRRTVAALDPAHTLLSLGGDHSITDPILRGLVDRRGGCDFGLIVIDAHLDSRHPDPGHEHSGHWMRTVRDAFDVSAAVQIGIDAPIYGPGHVADIEAQGGLIITPSQARRAGWHAAIDQALQHATRAGALNQVYVSLDIDAIAQSCAPGTSVPNPSGLFPHEVAEILYEVARRSTLVGFDMVEISPPLDPSGRTAEVGAYLLTHLLAGHCERGGS